MEDQTAAFGPLGPGRVQSLRRSRPKVGRFLVQGHGQGRIEGMTGSLACSPFLGLYSLRMLT